MNIYKAVAGIKNFEHPFLLVYFPFSPHMLAMPQKMKDVVSYDKKTRITEQTSK